MKIVPKSAKRMYMRCSRFVAISAAPISAFRSRRGPEEGWQVPPITVAAIAADQQQSAAAFRSTELRGGGGRCRRGCIMPLKDHEHEDPDAGDVDPGAAQPGRSADRVDMAAERRPPGDESSQDVLSRRRAAARAARHDPCSDRNGEERDCWTILAALRPRSSGFTVGMPCAAALSAA
jgi:hypothetical protein